MSEAWPPDLERDLRGRRGEALFLTRVNLPLGRALEARFPDLRWTVLTKNDVRGWGPRKLLDLQGSRPWAAMVLEDKPAELHRRRDLYRLMLLLSRSKSRWLLAASENGMEAEALPLVPGWIRILGVLVQEVVSSTRAIVSAYLLARRLDRPAPPASPPGRGRRVALLKTQFWFGVEAGGSVSHTLGVAGGMRALGLEPRMWTTSRLPDPAGELVQTEIPPEPRPSLFEEAAMAGFNRTFLQGVGPTVEEFAPVAVYHRHDVFNLAGLALARRLGVPLILEVNASEVWAREAWSRLFLKRLARRMEGVAFRRADRLVLISEELIPTVLALGGSRDRIVVNPNGVDVARFDPDDSGGEVRRELELPADAVLCGFLGTFARWHGVLFLAEQVPLLLRQDPRLAFLFLGDGDLRPEVELNLREAGATSRVRFPGMVPPARVPRYLAACDILLSPHLPFEDGTEFFGSPTKLFEYMAAGRAIVASRLGSIARLVDPGETGVLVPPGDGEAFRQSVLKLAGDPEERRRLGRQARALAERRFTWTANARRSLAGLVELPGIGDSGQA